MIGTHVAPPSVLLDIAVDSAAYRVAGFEGATAKEEV
jgi:hypothetical protein